MSQENVEIVKGLIPPAGTDYKDFFGDDVAWAAAKAVFAPHFASDFEGAFIAWGQPQTEFRGLDGLREAFLDWLAPWTSYYDQIEEVFAVGDERVVVLGREHGHRLDTGAEVTSEMAGVYFLRDRKIARIEYYAKQAEALEAVGLLGARGTKARSTPRGSTASVRKRR